MSSYLILSVPAAISFVIQAALVQLQIGSEQFLLRNLQMPITQVTATKDGKQLIAVSQGQQVLAWDIASSSSPRSCGVGTSWLAVSNDAKYLVSRWTLWSWTDYHVKPAAFLRDQPLRISSVLFSEDNKLLILADGKGGSVGQIGIWNIPSGKKRVPQIDYASSVFYDPIGKRDLLKLPAKLRSPPGVECMAISPDTTTLATAYRSTKIAELGSGTLKLWDMNTGKPIAHIFVPKRKIHTITFSRDSKRLILGVEYNKQGEILFMKLGAKQSELIGKHNAPIQVIALSDDGNYLASVCSNHVVKLWDMRNRRECAAKKLGPPSGPVRTMTFDCKNQKLYIGGGERRGWLRVWTIVPTPRAKNASPQGS